MLLVYTRLGRSEIHGLGLFAVDPIKAGTVVWRYEEPFDRKWTREYVASLPAVAQHHVLHFCALLRDGMFLVTGDNDRFWNHSDTPNCLTGEGATETVALRDIEAGEELTENYLAYCDEIRALMRCSECNTPLESDDLSERLCRNCREEESEPQPEEPIDFSKRRKELK